MDVIRRYYEDTEEFLRALNRQNHRRRHMPFWNLALSALHASETAEAAQLLQPLALTTKSSSPFGAAMVGPIQVALTSQESTASSLATGRVIYVTFHIPTPTQGINGSNSHGNTHTAGSSGVGGQTTTEETMVASALFTSSLLVLFCADDSLDTLVASWAYAEISAAHRNRGAPASSSVVDQHSPCSVVLTSLPTSIKPLKFNDTVSLYGSLAHVRALLDLANASARDTSLQALTSANRATGAPPRLIPSEYRFSRDDSGMRVLGRDARMSTRLQTSEFAFGPTLFKRRFRNACRLFFIAPERIEAIDKAYAEAATNSILTGTSNNSSTTPPAVSNNIPPQSPQKLVADAAKCLRLATVDDWEPLKAILKRETFDPDNTQNEDDEGEFDVTLEALQKGNVYVWERSSTRPSKSKSKPSKPKIRCFVVVEFHTRRHPEMSCVELIDLHVNDPRRDTSDARQLTESLCRKFLSSAQGAPPYHFLFVKVDISIPVSSDQFLLDCGFVADSVADFMTLESVQAKERRMSQQQPFEITRVVKISPLTEKPFSAYEIRVSETNELVKKRYREFDKLYSQLKSYFPGQNIPKLPKKKLFGNMDSDFIEKRRFALQTWLNNVALMPGVEESGWVANFLWTELKIRGVKGITEEERFIRTLQRQAEESKVNITQVKPPLASPSAPWPAVPSSASTSKLELGPKTTKPPKPNKKDKKTRRLSH